MNLSVILDWIAYIKLYGVLKRQVPVESKQRLEGKKVESS